jgi:hypothetical protein
LPPKEILHLKEVAIDLGSRKAKIPIRYMDVSNFHKTIDKLCPNPMEQVELMKIYDSSPIKQKMIKFTNPKKYEKAMKLKVIYTSKFAKEFQEEIKTDKIKPKFRLLLRQTKNKSGYFLVNLDTKKEIKLKITSKKPSEVTNEDYNELMGILEGKTKKVNNSSVSTLIEPCDVKLTF